MLKETLLLLSKEQEFLTLEVWNLIQLDIPQLGDVLVHAHVHGGCQNLVFLVVLQMFVDV